MDASELSYMLFAACASDRFSLFFCADPVSVYEAAHLNISIAQVFSLVKYEISGI